MQRILTVLLMGLSSLLRAQAPGDDIFGTNQILTVELEFSQPGFWDSLVANYATETYMQANVSITDLGGIHTFENIGVRLKGNSSYGHPGDKKSFKIDFNRYVDTLAYNKLIKLNFGNCFKDPTFIREKLLFDLSNASGVPAPRCIFANVYMNGTFWGFYDVVEQVDDDFLNTHFDNSSENLFKAGAGFGPATYFADLKYYGTDTAEYELRYSLENNAAENNWSDLIQLTNFINNSSDADFADSLALYFDVPVLMKSLVTDNLFANLDAYINSARNYYIYHNPNNGLWEWIKWDCNEAFGSYSGGGMGGGGITDMTTLETDYFNLSRPLLERIVSIAATRATYDYYYCVIKNNYFTEDYLFSRIDELYSLIQDAVYADDNKMYTNAQFDSNINDNITTGGGPGGGTIYGLKSFINERNSYLDAVIDCSEIGQAVNNMIEDQISLYPNPAQDMIQISYADNNAKTITILNLNGVVVDTFTQIGSSNTINISALSAGMYFIQVSDEHTQMVKTFVKL